MFALRHKFNGTMMYQTYETDNWGNNALVILVQEKNIKDYQYQGTTVYVQQYADGIEKLFTAYASHKHTLDEYAGTFDKPVMYVPLDEYEMVELEIVLK